MNHIVCALGFCLSYFGVPVGQQRVPTAFQNDITCDTSLIYINPLHIRYVDIAVSRTAGPGWWGKTWPRNVSDGGCSNPAMNASAWARSYDIGACVTHPCVSFCHRCYNRHGCTWWISGVRGRDVVHRELAPTAQSCRVVEFA
jgi:hypothetical protein